MTATWGRGERATALAVTAALVGAVLAPLRQNLRPLAERADGFPLSYYPMFSDRRRAHLTIHYMVGETTGGTRDYLPHQLLGPGGLNQVRRQLNRRIADGAAEDVARLVAARLARAGDRRFARVQVVTGRFHLDHCFSRHELVADERVLASAAVGS